MFFEGRNLALDILLLIYEGILTPTQVGTLPPPGVLLTGEHAAGCALMFKSLSLDPIPAT